jgi:hypothetical protein
VVGFLGLAIAVLIHRQQVTTQIFLEISNRYGELLVTSPTGMWTRAEAQLPDPSDELTVSILRYCSLVSFAYFLLQRRMIPMKMWALILPSVKRTRRNPLFVRKWKSVRSEFESFPDFLAFVVSI